MNRRSALHLLMGAGAPLMATRARGQNVPGMGPSAFTSWPVVPAGTPCPSEPNVEIARTWWAPQRDVWTPIGWKNHLFRFNVLYNGTLMFEPFDQRKPHTARYRDLDFQLTFTPSADGTPPPLPKIPTRVYHLDGGFGIQGWREAVRTPVLWTEWPLQEGLVLRQEVFAHVPGERPVATGIEPIYAWIRLSVVHVDEIRAVKRFAIALQLSRLYFRHQYPWKHEDGVVLVADPERAPLLEPVTSRDTRSGLRVVNAEGHVRLAIAPSPAGPVRFEESAPNSRIYNLAMELPGEQGAHTDLLVAALPQEPSAFDAELARGFDGALRACAPYWKETPRGAARVRTPEPFVNQVVERNIQFAQVVAEKNPTSGEYTLLSGSYGYDVLWSTPTSMTSHMLLDLLGHHEAVAQYAELYRRAQGTIKPPGTSYVLHPGYFSTPKTLTAIDWLSDHGAILHLVSYHALLSGDQRFIDVWLEPIVKACEFIEDACALTSHKGIKGLLPPAVATDEGVETQAVWVMGWNYKGLTSAVRLLRRLQHPRAGQLDAFATSFKSTFVDAYRACAAAGPTWTDANGEKHHVPQANLIPTKRHSFADLTLLDAGPLFHVWAGLMDADDPLMRSTVKFFREGPNRRLYGYRPNPLDRAVLIHEQSSGEPCYSWNICHSWQLGDRNRFLEGMYGLLTGAISPQTFISGEHRHGMYGNVFVAPLIVWCMRQAVVDDSLRQGEIHLLRLCPLAWISRQQETVFERMPTEHGPVNLLFGLSQDGTTLSLSFTAEWRDQPQRVVVHAPPIPGLQRLEVNGQTHDVSRSGTMTIPVARNL